MLGKPVSGVTQPTRLKKKTKQKTFAEQAVTRKNSSCRLRQWPRLNAQKCFAFACKGVLLVRRVKDKMRQCLGLETCHCSCTKLGHARVYTQPLETEIQTRN